MLCIAMTFIYSILTFYSIYRYASNRNELFEKLTIAHLQMKPFYLMFVFMIAYAGNLVVSNVNIDKYLNKLTILILIAFIFI